LIAATYGQVRRQKTIRRAVAIFASDFYAWQAAEARSVEGIAATRRAETEIATGEGQANQESRLTFFTPARFQSATL
jgi:hypothetical protein